MKKIVVLGAGYAGIKTVVKLQKKMKNEVEITLVDRNSYHYETTRLPDVATGENSYTQISYEINDVIKKSMTTFIQDEVVKINPEEKTVELKNHPELHYDYLVLGLGFTFTSMGIPGVEQYGMPMYNPKTAIEIRDHVLNEMKEYRKDKDKKHLQIVICGAGFKACELAGAFRDAAPRYAKIAGVQPEDIRITSFDASHRLLPMFDGKIYDYAIDAMKKQDLNIIYPSYIKELTEDGVKYNLASDPEDEKPRELRAGTMVWMMGFIGSPVIQTSGFKQRRNRILVDDHLTVPGFENVYSLGDVSNVLQPGKKWPYPNTAQLALSMANYAADDIKARINGQTRPNKYAYHDLGVCVKISEHSKAAAVALGHGYKGYMASVLKKLIADRSLMETGGIKEVIAQGEFDFWH